MPTIRKCYVLDYFLVVDYFSVGVLIATRFRNRHVSSIRCID